MKASLDALYTMKTSGAIPAQYQAGIEPLKLLGCFIERLPDGEIIMHQRSYIDHCLKNNDMMMLKSAKSLPCVDEKSPPEDPYEDDGTPTSFETDKAACQKYIGHSSYPGDSGFSDGHPGRVYKRMPCSSLAFHTWNKRFEHAFL